MSGFSSEGFFHPAHQLATLCTKCTRVPGYRSHWHFMHSPSFICSSSPPTLIPLSPIATFFSFHAFLRSLTQKALRQESTGDPVQVGILTLTWCVTLGFHFTVWDLAGLSPYGGTKAWDNQGPPSKVSSAVLFFQHPLQLAQAYRTPSLVSPLLSVFASAPAGQISV